MNNYKLYRWLLKKESITITVLLLVCLGLRVFNFASASIWSDEGATMYLAHKTPKGLWKISISDVNPPLYGWIVHYWAKFFGYTHVSFRSFSIVCSFFTALVLYRTGRKFFNYLTGLFAAIIFTISNFHIYYAEEARCYAFIGFLTAISLYYLISFIKYGNKKALIGLTLANMAMLYTHYISGFLFIGEGLVVFLCFYNRIKLVAFYIFSQTLVLCAFLPWFFSSWIKVDGFANSWYPELSYELVYNYFLSTFNSEKVMILWLVLIGLALLLVFLERFRPKVKPLFLLFLLSVIPLSIICIITLFYVRIFYDRYELFATVPMFLFLGFLIASIRLGTWFRLFIMIVVLFYAVPNIKVDAFRGIAWDAACTTGNALIDGKTSVLLHPHYASGCYDYYGLRWAYLNDYESLQKNREQQYNTFRVMDTNSIKQFRGKLYDRVMYYSTHYWENDNKAVEKFLLKDHEQVFFKEFWGVRLYIFQRKK